MNIYWIIGLAVLYVLSVIVLFAAKGSDSSGYQDLKGTLIVVYAMPLMLAGIVIAGFVYSVSRTFELIRRNNQ